MKISCKGYHLDLNMPVVMGVINCTPDSFYGGGRAHHLDNLLEKVALMIDQGAKIIDVGGVSTRPGATPVEESEEIKRVIPVLKLLAESFPHAWFSLDTFRARVASMGVDAGARMINDISAGSLDSDLLPVVASLKVPYVLMHMHGTPQHMQESPLDKDIVAVVTRFFNRKLEELAKLGINQVILDPGYGFGKSTAANYVLLKNQAQLRINGLPLLTGISRKSMINKVLNTTPEQALNGTTILNTLALLNGASILRVHDVAEAMECIRLTSFFQQTHG